MNQEQKALRIKALEMFAGMLDNISDLKTVTRLHDSCIIVETLQGVVLKFLLVANARPDTSNSAPVCTLDSVQLATEGLPVNTNNTSVLPAVNYDLPNTQTQTVI